MDRSTYMHVSDIRTTPEKLWSALTDPEFIRPYWFGMNCECDFQAGSRWRLVVGDGTLYDSGEILEAEPPRCLVIRWGTSTRRAQRRARLDLHDGAVAQRDGGQAHHHPLDRLHAVEIDRGGVRWMAQGHLQPQVLDGDGAIALDGPHPPADRGGEAAAG